MEYRENILAGFEKWLISFFDVKKFFPPQKNNSNSANSNTAYQTGQSQLVKFEFRTEPSNIFGEMSIPLVTVQALAKKKNSWLKIQMLVDTGADYTILPKFLADELDISLDGDCKIFTTVGVGGKTKVYFCPKLTVKVGEFLREIPVGFMDSDYVPPLMGRQGFFETFNTQFVKNQEIWFGE